MPPLARASYANCQPQLGWGMFDLEVMPPNRLEVRIRCFFQTEAAVGPINIDDYLGDWQTSVSALWDNKVRLRVNAANNEELSVTFHLALAKTLGACHFPILIKAGGYAAGAGLYFPDPNLFGGNRMYLKLGTLDNQTWLQGSAANINAGVPGARALMFMDQRDRVLQSLPGVGVPGFHDSMDIQMNLAGGSWSVAPASQPVLDALCQSLAGTPPWLPQPAVRISSSSGVQQKSMTLPLLSVAT